MIYKFEIFGNPVPLKRARISGGRGKYAMFDSQVDAKTAFKWKCLVQQKPGKKEILDGNIKAYLEFHYQTPKSWSKKKREKMNGKFKNTKPDLDNLIKFVFDALEGTFFTNDSRIVDIHAFKVFSEEAKTVMIFEGI